MSDVNGMACRKTHWGRPCLSQEEYDVPWSGIGINNLQVNTNTGLTEMGSSWTNVGKNEAATDDVILVNEITDDLVFFKAAIIIPAAAATDCF